jgi:hypothetical protein
MGQCDAQTDSPSGTPLQSKLRGLELIKSCAMFYENGVGVAKPTIQISRPLSAPVSETRQTSPSRRSRSSISPVALICLFFLVLPSFGLAMIVWSAAKSGDAKGSEMISSSATAVSAQASPITSLHNVPVAGAAKTASNSQSGILIRKVKTQPIIVDASGGPDQ